MAPLAEVGGFLGGLEGLGQQVGSHFLLPPAGERPPLLGERRGAAERGARGGPGAAELAHLHGILRRRQLYCRTGFHLQILPDGSVQGTRQDHSLFGTYQHPAPTPPLRLLFRSPCASLLACQGCQSPAEPGVPMDPSGVRCRLGLRGGPAREQGEIFLPACGRSL
ncbi:fibroblast growth factor 20 [Carlito syrichta]|uniref:Fibroblast growth factor 20 n=1 Tax=Carlito syrichta TaxID=1868482 RepID=A0A1U7TH83_CARSF|nr:fibroblast growth factor 20 [Carlito syrichta]